MKDSRRAFGAGTTSVFSEERKRTLAVGICASDDAVNLSKLLSFLRDEPLGEDFELRRVVAVASGCTEESLRLARKQRDERFYLIEQKERKGKAEAINKIIERCAEDFLLFVNGDSLPASGAVQKLLSLISRDNTAAVVSARPVFVGNNSPISGVLELMWKVHNECAKYLNHAGLGNHCSDEMMVVRRELVCRLPAGLVNDGAYIAGRAFSLGYGIKFQEDALVRISVPSRLSDLIRQRRRILFGHIQVWKLLGSTPRTVESLLLILPTTSIRILVRILARSPRLIRFIPIAVIEEAISLLAAACDSARSTTKHAVWKRYGE